MEVLLLDNVDKDNIKENFKKEITESLLNRKFEKTDSIKLDIPKIVAEKFIINVLSSYKNIQEFDVSPVKNGNIHLIKVQTIDGESLVEVLLTTVEEESEILINNVITSVKHF